MLNVSKTGVVVAVVLEYFIFEGDNVIPKAINSLLDIHCHTERVRVCLMIM